ncbi:uncharacterized protein LOC142538902 [Primulina tabacum]|uniref:uncharacterized protein LOC142538902 n=1 Tax=Primulina tabacum TaxID=48773 RepID=UPI003F598622
MCPSRKSQRISRGRNPENKNPLSMLRPIISATFPASSMAEDSNQRFSMSTSIPLGKHCSQNWVSRVNYHNGSSSIGRLSSFRTAEEFSTGHVAGAINVPFLLRVGPGMTHNPKFLEEV